MIIPSLKSGQKEVIKSGQKIFEPSTQVADIISIEKLSAESKSGQIEVVKNCQFLSI